MPDYEERQEAKKMRLEGEAEGEHEVKEDEVKEGDEVKEDEEAKEEEFKEEWPEEMQAEDEAKMTKIQETEEKMKIITENRL